MGYYSSFQLDVEPRNMVEVIRQHVTGGMFQKGDCLFQLFESDMGLDEAKWYNRETDMLRLSAEFPDVTFELSGQGEDRDDVWSDTYKNGQIISSSTSELIDGEEAAKLKALNGFFGKINGARLREQRDNLKMIVDNCTSGTLKAGLDELQSLIADLAMLANRHYEINGLIEGEDSAAEA